MWFWLLIIIDSLKFRWKLWWLKLVLLIMQMLLLVMNVLVCSMCGLYLQIFMLVCNSLLKYECVVWVMNQELFIFGISRCMFRLFSVVEVSVICVVLFGMKQGVISYICLCVFWIVVMCSWWIVFQFEFGLDISICVLIVLFLCSGILVGYKWVIFICEGFWLLVQSQFLVNISCRLCII